MTCILKINSSASKWWLNAQWTEHTLRTSNCYGLCKKSNCDDKLSFKRVLGTPTLGIDSFMKYLEEPTQKLLYPGGETLHWPPIVLTVNTKKIGRFLIDVPARFQVEKLFETPKTSAFLSLGWKFPALVECLDQRFQVLVQYLGDFLGWKILRNQVLVETLDYPNL